MREYVDFHYTPLEGKITGKQVLKQTEDAINDLGNHLYELDIDESRIDEAVEKSEQAIETAESALSAVTTDRSVWKNTVADMKATNIEVGVTAATRGENLYNDGDGAFFVVRQEKSGDVDGEDTVFLGNGNVAERLKQFNLVAKGNNIIYVENVASLRGADAVIGNVYGTTGYYSANDGGASIYTIRAKTQSDVEDGGHIIFLVNGNVAELITDGTVNVKQFGAKGDGVTDDRDVLQYCFNKYKNVALCNGDTYHIKKYLDIQDVTIYGNGATISIEKHTEFTIKEGHKHVFYVYDNAIIKDVHVVGAYTDNAERYPAAPQSGDNYDQGGLTVYGDHVIVQNCTFRYIREGAILIYGENVHNVCIECCKVTESGIGFYAETQGDATGINYAVVVRNCYFDANHNGCGIGNTLFDTCVFEQMRDSSRPNFNVGINDANVEFSTVNTFINCDFIADYTTGAPNVTVYGFNQAQTSTHTFSGKGVFIGCRFSGVRTNGLQISANATFKGCVFAQFIYLMPSSKNGIVKPKQVCLETCEWLGHPSSQGIQYLVLNYSTNTDPTHITMINCFVNEFSSGNLRLFSSGAENTKIRLCMMNCTSGTNNTANIEVPYVMFGNVLNGTDDVNVGNAGYSGLIRNRCITDANVNTVAVDANNLTNQDFLTNALGVYDFSDGHVYFVGHNRAVKLD